MGTPGGHRSTSIRLGEVAFELYSHATDPVRTVQSVHTVAGIPVMLQSGSMDETCNGTQCDDVSNHTAHLITREICMKDT